MKVCLDACVLYPTVLREILVGVAAEGVYRPVWSDRILEEWARATPKLGPGAEAIARAEIARLRADWPGAAVAPRPRDLDRLWLPDPNDVHVFASAIAAGADRIVTFNARDFPKGPLAAEGVVRVDPDQFLGALWPDHGSAVARSVAAAHGRACEVSGEALPLRPFLKRARLPKLGKRLG